MDEKENKKIYYQPKYDLSIIPPLDPEELADYYKHTTRHNIYRINKVVPIVQESKSIPRVYNSNVYGKIMKDYVQNSTELHPGSTQQVEFRIASQVFCKNHEPMQPDNINTPPNPDNSKN
jgi:hypothetical protein